MVDRGMMVLRRPAGSRHLGGGRMSTPLWVWVVFNAVVLVVLAIDLGLTRSRRRPLERRRGGPLGAALGLALGGLRRGAVVDPRPAHRAGVLHRLPRRVRAQRRQPLRLPPGVRVLPGPAGAAAPAALLGRAGGLRAAGDADPRRGGAGPGVRVAALPLRRLPPLDRLQARPIRRRAGDRPRPEQGAGPRPPGAAPHRGCPGGPLPGPHPGGPALHPAVPGPAGGGDDRSACSPSTPSPRCWG